MFYLVKTSVLHAVLKLLRNIQCTCSRPLNFTTNVQLISKISIILLDPFKTDINENVQLSVGFNMVAKYRATFFCQFW